MKRLEFEHRATKGKKKARELQAVATWLQATWPCPIPVKIVMVDEIKGQDKGTVGLCDYQPEPQPHATVYITAGEPLAWQIDTLFHEWTHCVQVPFIHPWSEDHDAEFWLMFGRIHVSFFEGGGDIAVAGL
jgi:hypothetical protein